MNNTVCQYFSSRKILNMIKELMDDKTYCEFITSLIDGENINLEDKIINTLSKKELLEHLEKCNNDLYNRLINNMIQIVYLSNQIK